MIIRYYQDIINQGFGKLWSLRSAIRWCLKNGLTTLSLRIFDELVHLDAPGCSPLLSNAEVFRS
jgi:hypothetical protein